MVDHGLEVGMSIMALQPIDHVPSVRSAGSNKPIPIDGWVLVQNVLQPGDEIAVRFPAPVVSRGMDRVAKVLAVAGTAVRVDGDHEIA